MTADLFERLISLSNQFPELRLGQLLANAIPEEQLFYISDIKLIEQLEAFYGGLQHESKYKPN